MYDHDLIVLKAMVTWRPPFLKKRNFPNRKDYSDSMADHGRFDVQKREPAMPVCHQTNSGTKLRKHIWLLPEFRTMPNVPNKS